MTNLLQKIKAPYFKSLKGEENFWVSVWLWSILFYHGFFLISAFCAMAFDIFIKTKMPDISLAIIILFLFFNFPYLVRSAKNVLNGKERLWKVFWLWVVVLYFVDSFLTVYSFYKIRYDYLVPALLSFYNYQRINLLILYSIIHINLILVPFLALILKRNFENLDIKNPYLRRITVFVPFILVFLMCLIGIGVISASVAITTGYFILTIISYILPIWLYGKIFKNFYYNSKYNHYQP